jgi:hypothetical protein
MKYLALLFSSLLLATMSPAADTPVYELRTYITNEGKLPDLLTRFRDHTCKLFEKHGMKNIGYWVPVDKENGADNTLIYILEHKSREAAKESFAAFAADPEWKSVRENSEKNGKILAKAPESVFMTLTDFSPPVQIRAEDGPVAFELRIYTTPDGKLDALHSRFRNHTMKLFEKHGMTNLPYFKVMDEDKGAKNKLIYLLKHESKEAGLKSFGEFRADPDWVKAKGESEKDGSLTIPQPDGVKSIYMKATDFSPIN